MTVKEKVKTILEKYPDARNSDRKLIVWLWWYFHGNRFEKQEDGELWIRARDVFDFESTETIRRIRQKFQEAGQYQSDKQIAEERAKKAKGVRFTINNDSYGERYLPS